MLELEKSALGLELEVELELVFEFKSVLELESALELELELKPEPEVVLGWLVLEGCVVGSTDSGPPRPNRGVLVRESDKPSGEWSE